MGSPKYFLCEMISVKKNFIFLSVFCMIFGHVDSIITKPEANKVIENGDGKREDNIAAGSIDRDYIAGYDEGYGGHGEHHGLSSYSSHGFSEGYETYGGLEDIKHHTHHLQDHHHHHHLDSHHHHHHHGHQKHHDYSKALAIKGLLVPLAGVALLGAAAAFVSNPILLQLGVISSTALGRRKRDTREITISPENQTRLNELKLLERFMAQLPKEEIEKQEKKIFADYLSCSGATTSTLCLERLICELHSPEGISMPMEANILTIVVNEILANDFVPRETKLKISKAVSRGKKNLGCKIYKCKELEKPQEFREFER